jgi:adenylate kinase
MSATAERLRHVAVLLLGPTGAGKTPLGEAMEREGFMGRRCHHLDFGAQLRRVRDGLHGHGAFTPAEVAFVRSVLDAGALLESAHFHVARRVLEAFLAERGVESGDWLALNGLPRHAEQARDVDGLLDVRVVVALECAPEVAPERIRTNVGGDRTGRDDDAPEAVVRKLRLYEERTRPLLDHYAGKGASIVRIPVAADDTAASLWSQVQGAIGTGEPRRGSRYEPTGQGAQACLSR